VSIRDILVTGRTARLPGDYGPVTDEELRRKSQFHAAVTPAATVIPADKTPADAPAGHSGAANGLPEGAVAEFRFHRQRKFCFDWAWPARLVALEIEGGLFGRGKRCPTCGRRAVAGHSSIERIKTDMEKYNLASLAGWRILRATPQQFESGEAGRLVRLALATSGLRR
jgi:hypothetical protein